MIVGAIRSGDLKPGDRLGSARQLADKWETSYGAVRQSLEVLAAKGIVVRRPRAGTFVSSSATSLPTEDGSPAVQQGIIGLLVPDISTPDGALVTRHMQDVCNAAHMEVLVSSTDNDRDRYDQIIDRHIKANVSGLALVAPHRGKLSLETLAALEKSGIPVVTYARSIDVANWPTVRTDVYQSVYIAVRHLCELGRKRIAFLRYPSPIDADRRLGLYRALAEAGLTAANVVEYVLPDDLYLQANDWVNNGRMRDALAAWVDENPTVDAVYCAHDHIAAALWKVLRNKGRRVPDDVALVGSGNMLEWFGLSPGELTTIDTCVPDAATEMLRLLTSAGQAPEPGAPAELITIQPRLVIGESTVPNQPRS